MVIGTTNKKQNKNWKNTKEQIQKFKYLRAILNSNGNFDNEVNERINAIKFKILNRKEIPKENKQ